MHTAKAASRNVGLGPADRGPGPVEWAIHESYWPGSANLGPMERTTSGGAIGTLDELATRGPDELMDLYRSARTPRLEDLDGKLSGRMLAVPRIQKPQVKTFLERFSKSKLFP